MNNKIWTAIGIAALAAMTHYLYRFQRVGWEGVFPWPKWVQHDASQEGKVVGTLKIAEFYTGDGDMTLQVQPRPEYQWILLNRKNEIGGNWNGNIELEVEVRDDAHYASAYLDQVKALLGKEVTAIGVLVDDMEIPPKTELHTLELIYGLYDSNTYKIAAATDDSWIQHPPLSDKPTHKVVTFPNVTSYDVKVIQSVASEVKYSLGPEGLTMDLLMHSRKDGGPAAYVADVIIH